VEGYHKNSDILTDDEFRSLLLRQAKRLILNGKRVTSKNLQRSTGRLRESRCTLMLHQLILEGVIAGVPERDNHPPAPKPHRMSNEEIQAILLRAWKKDGIYPSRDASRRLGIKCTEVQFSESRSREWLDANNIKLRQSRLARTGRTPKPEVKKKTPKVQREGPMPGSVKWHVMAYRRTWPRLWALLKNRPIDVIAEPG
jgi:hypothetical protein